MHSHHRRDVGQTVNLQNYDLGALMRRDKRELYMEGKTHRRTTIGPEMIAALDREAQERRHRLHRTISTDFVRRENIGQNAASEWESSATEIHALEREQYQPGVTPDLIRRVMQQFDTLTYDQMRDIAARGSLETPTSKSEARKLLLEAFRPEYAKLRLAAENSLPEDRRTAFHFDYLCTTRRENVAAYPHEIIELPGVLINVRRRQVVSEFQTFVRPRENPILDPFCTELTGITQRQVDRAPFFPEALARFMEWLNDHGLKYRPGRPAPRFAFVTDSACDFAKFLQFQCILLDIEMPFMFRSFINIKKYFCTKVTKLDRKNPDAYGNKTSIEKMLQHYGIRPIGRSHSGLDDARNIARLTLRMLEEKNIVLRINQTLRPREDAKPKAYELVDTSLWDLPLALTFVSREDFLGEAYLDCDEYYKRLDAEEEPQRAIGRRETWEEGMEVLEQCTVWDPEQGRLNLQFHRSTSEPVPLPLPRTQSYTGRMNGCRGMQQDPNTQRRGCYTITYQHNSRPAPAGYHQNREMRRHEEHNGPYPPDPRPQLPPPRPPIPHQHHAHHHPMQPAYEEELDGTFPGFHPAFSDDYGRPQGPPNSGPRPQYRGAAPRAPMGRIRPAFSRPNFHESDPWQRHLPNQQRVPPVRPVSSADQETEEQRIWRQFGATRRSSTSTDRRQ
ncbi:unnamed protein product, partial [Mesorhabditis spiculigera]